MSVQTRDVEVSQEPGEHGASHLAHHFDNPDQQFTSSKLGMWIFLGTELLMFGGLFCAYAFYRGHHPEIFRYASVLLDTRLGALNTLILITSSLTMAMAVNSAQRGRRGALIGFLSLTFLGACGFLVIKYTEYRPKIEHGLLWGTHYKPDPAYVAHHYGVEEPAGAHGAAAAGKAETPVDLARGESIVKQTCASCHGSDLRGLPNNGVDLVASEFVGAKSDAELVTFLKTGRQPFDPDSKTRLQMPPRGGNPMLTDEMLRDTVAYLRSKWTGAAPDAAVAAAAPAESAAVAVLEVPRSVLPPAAEPPSGLVAARAAVVPMPGLPAEPRNVQHFFGIYFLMTGLHAIHVIAGMGIIGWLIVGAVRGKYGASYFTPVDLGGLFWHLVDLIWIFLFPLFYLI